MLAVLAKASVLISLWKAKAPLLALVPEREAVRLSRWLRRALPRGALRVLVLLLEQLTKVLALISALKVKAPLLVLVLLVLVREQEALRPQASVLI